MSVYGIVQDQPGDPGKATCKATGREVAIANHQVGSCLRGTSIDPMAPIRCIVQPENQTYASRPHHRRKDHVRPCTMADDDIEELLAEQVRKSHPGPQDSPWAADSYASQNGRRESRTAQPTSKISFEAQGEMGLHSRTQIAMHS